MHPIISRHAICDFQNSQQELGRAGRQALADRNLEKLKTLADSHPLSAFLNLDDVKRFFQIHAGKFERDLPLMEWLLEEFGDQIDCCDTAFIEAAKNGEKGLPMMQLLLEKGKVDFYGVRKVFEIAATHPRYGELLMGWLLQNAREKISYEDLKSAFDFAARLDYLPRMKLIWEHTRDTERFLYEKYVEMILDNGLGRSNGVEVLEWLAHRLLVLHGTQLHISPCYLDQLKPTIAALLEKHLNAMGITKTKKQIKGPGHSIELNKVDLRSLFEEMKPTGLPFFESACRRMSDQISSYTIKWAFVKAAAHGPAGLDLMQRLRENFKEQLSLPTLLRAMQIAEKYGSVATAAWICGTTATWIMEQPKSFFGKETHRPLDSSDVKLMLASSQNPSGYRPLGDAPERYHWKPLSQEELDEMISAQDPVLAEFGDPFEGSDVTVIDDERAEPPSLNEIRRCEGELFCQLYARIKLGQAPMKIEGSDEFRDKMLEVIRMLLSRPSGRWAFLFACRLPYPLRIVESDSTVDGSVYSLLFQSISVNFSGEGTRFIRTREGKVEKYELHMDSTFFHEMLHAINDGQNRDLGKELKQIKPSDKNYDNLEEQRTIAGVDKECDMYEAFALSENVYNFERGYPKRYGHKAL